MHAIHKFPLHFAGCIAAKRTRQGNRKQVDRAPLPARFGR